MEENAAMVTEAQSEGRIANEVRASQVTPDFLQRALGGLNTPALLQKLLLEAFPGRVAVVSSFGADAAVLLDLVARIDTATPVLFLDTGKNFPETLAYRAQLTQRLRLSDVRVLTAAPAALQTVDPMGTLWRETPDSCCDARKVTPLAAALTGFDAWISGRKRHPSESRRTLPIFENDAGRIKINPLAMWTAEQVDGYYASFGLPRHPLFHQGVSVHRLRTVHR